MFAIKRRSKKGKESLRFKINEMIRAPKLRVVFPDGGAKVMSSSEALEQAREYNLDLIEVVSNSDPPVCKIFDVGKYKYELEKKMKESKKHQKTMNIKEMRIRPSIGEHDYQVKLRHIIEFLQHQDKVKINIYFKGREITHSDLGMEMANKLQEDLKEYGEISNTPKLEGRNITVIFSPVKTKNK